MQEYKILIVEDDDKMRMALEHILKKEGYCVESVSIGEEALSKIKNTDYEIIVSDLKLPGIDGLELLKAALRYKPGISFIMMTAYATVDSAVRAMKDGAEDYIAKPFNLEEIRIIIRKVIDKRNLLTKNKLLQNQLTKKYEFANIIGKSESMIEVYKIIAQVKDSKSTVLILGETGTGKEMIARAIHYNSLRADNLFLPVNCGALHENLLASELFGYVKGAFTGAHRDKRGIFEVAQGGTIFLDEIGDIGLGLQQILLRVLDNGKIQPVGTTERKKVDVRIVAATNKDLEKMVHLGEFREDLFYRLNVITINIPPLRERKEDIASLANHFLCKYSQENNIRFDGISMETFKVLENYYWHGNVRELENVIERAALLETTSMITPKSIPSKIQEYVKHIPDDKINKDIKTLEDVEKNHVIKILKETGGNKAHASQILGINRTTLWRMLQKYEISEREIKEIGQGKALH